MANDNSSGTIALEEIEKSCDSSEAQIQIDNNVQSLEEREVKVKGGKGYLFAKRTFDIISSFLVLVFIGWFILLLMFIKFCEDGHNPVYTSIRVGKNGKLFKFHKIRSMVPNAENMRAQLIKDGMNEMDGPVFKNAHDPRVTRFGRFLRKTSLDELPQIWDIFVGRLSVVGPRSPLPEEVEQVNHLFNIYLLEVDYVR